VPPIKPPTEIELLSAAVLLLQKLVEQTNEIEPLLKRISAKQDETNAILRKILSAVSPKPPADKKLTTIKLVFTEIPMSTNPIPITPPVVLTQAGQQVQAQVVGYDQFGNPWTGTMPDYTLTNDNESAATLDPISGLVTAVADGVSNITGELTTAEGLDLTDTESVTVNIAAEPPVLTTVKVVFTQPAGALSSKVKKPVVKR